MEPRIQPKSEYQKDDCLFCKGTATLEAVCGEGNVSSTIRCCSREDCQEKAKKFAKESLVSMQNAWGGK